MIFCSFRHAICLLTPSFKLPNFYIYDKKLLEPMIKLPDLAARVLDRTQEVPVGSHDGNAGLRAELNI